MPGVPFSWYPLETGRRTDARNVNVGRTTAVCNRSYLGREAMMSLRNMRCEIRIGTSGWHYQHWRGHFYPADLPPSRMFDYYAKHFDTVELNNTFYRLPTEDAIDAWRDAAPGNFVFAVKASRFLTHRIKLKDP